MVEKNYSDFQIEAFSEIGNTAVGLIATALSKMFNKNIDISIPETKRVPLGEFANNIGGPESIVQCLYLKVEGDLKGESLFLFAEKDALKIIDLMMGQEIGTAKEMDEMGQSAFAEMSNIVVGAYLNAIADMFSMKLLPQPPLTANDMAQAVIDSILAEFGKAADKIISIKTMINIEGCAIEGIFVMLFDNKSLDKILKKISEKYEIDVK